MPRNLQNNTADTRQRLLQAALKAFGHRDYEAVSTREIVRAADANISAISYHFGGKQGLYLATAEYLAETIHTTMAPHLQHIQQASLTASPQQCRQLLANLMARLVRNLALDSITEDAAGLIFREQHHPTEAFEILYKQIFAPMHDVISQLIAKVWGLPADAPEVLTTSHALFGQVIIFRIGRTTILRRLGLPVFGDSEVRIITELVTSLALHSLNHHPLQEQKS
ncbi:CerR family C-terminal domain-containing protein [Candidatus Endoriftia persephone]|jgi:AcrR family transcriptional regulator|uniref:Transcriptional regulator, TetR family n=3 Tax=Gammaproteobacteria TaxID=1236 RepID=G2FGR2_9GAMM|nr:CerR family C-terminal domain-containing protein [Candidatus Endoriftia persephone]EGV51487.1 HTH-type transcriptional regulator [endosymbiont of Riftia pachyptila (vent Ph05)]EGW54026.1 transcriptional regulator, TetR family [endosymbiont of Tevnia jerichonana (vent Tica)]USF86573.1 CerR family C-terminal domain-containing protein [Candidatus Endoriftia persephone]